MTSHGRRAVAQPTVAVIGGGIGGIAACVRLKKAGFHRFTLFERSAGPGGTWRDNTYPGASCDIPSHLYSFSFRRHDWARTHSPQPEILDYLERCVDEFGIREHCRFDTRIVEAWWCERRQRWSLRADDGAQTVADVLVCATGLYSEPRTPDIPGMDEFQGPVFHTARWEHRHVLSAKRIAVVGTGSSAAQVVPRLAERAARLHVFQREPGWVLPRDEHALSAAERRAFRRRFGGWWERGRLFRVTDGMAAGLDPRSPLNRGLVAGSRRFLASSVADPQVRTLLTPTHPAFCKRAIFSDDFWPAFGRPGVELVPAEVTRLTRTGVVAANGAEREVDAVVLATGFRTTEYVSTIDIRGRDGTSLAEHWSGEPSAFLGMCVSGFPNLFLLYGPNSAPPSTSVIFVLERQAEYVARIVRMLARTGLASVDVRPRVQRAYNRWLTRRLSGTAFTAGCHNHYRSSSGAVVTALPVSASRYWVLTRLCGGWAAVYRRQRRRG